MADLPRPAVPPPGPEPTGKTVLGVYRWRVSPDQVLTWGGDHNMVRRCPLVAKGGALFAGAPVEAVSGRCADLGEARRAVAAWIAKGRP